MEKLSRDHVAPGDMSRQRVVGEAGVSPTALPKWVADVTWWFANSFAAGLFALTMWALLTLFGLSVDPATIAVAVATGWLIGRSGMR